MKTVREFCAQNPGKMETVRFVLFSKEVLAVYERACRADGVSQDTSKEFRDKIQNDLRKHSDLREKTRNQGEQDERRMYCM